MKKIVVIGGVVIVAAAVISPYYMGKRIESGFEQKVTVLNNKIDKYFHVKDFVKLEYKAGWFSSTAKTIIGDIVINHTITHGPYCFFGLGRIESTFEIPKNSQQKYNELKAFFNGQDPYRMTTEVGYTGTTYFNLHSPAIGEKSLPEKPNSKVTWQGLDFSAKFTKNEVESSFEMPKFVFSEKDRATFSIEGLKSKGTSDRLFDNELNFMLPEHFNINSTASLDKIALAVPSHHMPVINLEINKLIAQTIGKNNAVTTQLSVDKVTGAVNVFENNAISIDNIKMKGESVDVLWFLRSDLAKANWASKAVVDVTDIQATIPSWLTDITLNYHQEQELLDDGNKLGYGELYRVTDLDGEYPVSHYNNLIKQAEFGYKIAGLPKEQTAGLLKDYLETMKFALMLGITQGVGYNQPLMVQYQNKLKQSVQKWGIASLQNTPSVEAHFNLQGDKGKADINFNASLIKPDDATDPLQLIANAIPRLNAKLSAKVPKALVNSVLEGSNIPNEQLVHVEELVKERYPSVIKSDEYDVNVEFKEGQFFVNGQLDPELAQKVLSTFK